MSREKQTVSKRPKRHFINMDAMHWTHDVALVLDALDPSGRRLDASIGGRIVTYLGYRADAENGIEIGQNELALACRCSARTVRNWLSAMEDQRLLRRTKKVAGSTARGRPTDYIVLTLMDIPAPSATNIAPKLQTRVSQIPAPSAANLAMHLPAPGAELPAPRTELAAPGAALLNIINNTPLNTPLPSYLSTGATDVQKQHQTIVQMLGGGVDAWQVLTHVSADTLSALEQKVANGTLSSSDLKEAIFEAESAGAGSAGVP